MKSESEVAQWCPTLSDPMDCSPLAPLSLGFSRQENWSGVPLALPLPLSRVFSNTHSSEASILQHSAFFKIIVIIIMGENKGHREIPASERVKIK